MELSEDFFYWKILLKFKIEKFKFKVKISFGRNWTNQVEFKFKRTLSQLHISLAPSSIPKPFKIHRNKKNATFDFLNEIKSYKLHHFLALWKYIN